MEKSHYYQSMFNDFRIVHNVSFSSFDSSSLLWNSQTDSFSYVF